MFLILQKSLLEFSFIFANKHDSSYIQLLVFITRPQALLQISNLDFLYIIWTLLYLAGIYWHYPGIKYISLYLIIFRSALYQFIFEQLSTSYLRYFLQFMMSMQMLLQLIYTQGTLNIRTKNLQYTQISLLDVIICILDIIIVFLVTESISVLFISVIAIINSSFKVINQYLYSPYKNYKITVAVSSIYVITIIKAITAIGFQINNDVDILIWPLIVFIILKIYRKLFLSPATNLLQLIYFYQDQPNLPLQKLKVIGNSEMIICSSIYFDRKQLYVGFYSLKQIKDSDLTFCQIVQKNCLLQICFRLVCEIIKQEKNTTNGNYESYIQAFQNMENYFSEIQHLIEVTLLSKVKSLLKMQGFHHQQIRDYIASMELVMTNEKIIKEKYLLCQTQKMQSVLGFYYVEIMNDFLAAASLFRIDSSDDRINRLQIDSKLFTDDVSFIVSKLDKDLSITKCSSNISNVIHQDFKYLQNQSIKLLIPDGIRQVHDELIKNFMAGGQCKFYNNFDNNIILQDCDLQIYVNVDMCINLYFTDDIYFITLFQNSNSKQLSIVLGQDLKICSMSLAFIETLGLQKTFPKYQKVPILTMLPSFIAPTNEQFQNYSNQDLVLLQMAQSKSSLNSESKFTTSYSIKYREIQATKEYYILTFEYFKKARATNEDDSEISLQDSYSQLQQYEYQMSEGPLAHSPFQLITYQMENTHEIQQQGTTYACKASSENMVQIFNSPRSQENLTQKLFSPQRSQDYVEVLQNELQNSNFVVKNDGRSENTARNMIVIQDNHYASSQMSSVTGIHSFKYFKKYDLVHKIGERSNSLHYHNHLIWFILLFMSLLITLQSACLYLSTLNLNKLIIDIDLLQITNFLFAPLEDQIILKSQLINYQMLYMQKQLNSTYFAQLTLYPNLYIGSSFLELKTNADSLLDRQMLQTFLQNQYLNVQEQVSTNQSQIYNVTVRNSVNLLLNYQYASATQLKEALDQGLATDKTFVFFTLKNLIPIKQTFQILENQVEIETLITCSNVQTEHQTLFIIELVSTVLQLLFVLCFYKLILIQQKQYFKLFFLISKASIKQEINQCNYFLQSIKKNPEDLFEYQFSLNQKDKWIDQRKQQYLSERKHEFKISLFQLFNWRWTIFLSLSFFMILINCFLTYISLQNYLNQYPDTIMLYRKISILGVDLPTLYSRKENYQYRSIYPFFSPADGQALVSDLLVVLGRIEQFSQMNVNLQIILVSNNFRNLYTLAMESNLCNLLPEKIQNNSISLCPKVLNSQMSQGISGILVSIINQFKNDYQINQFSAKLSSPILELEGIFMINEILLNINEEFKIDLWQFSSELKFNLVVQNIVLILLQFFMLIGIMWSIKYVLIRKNEVIQKIPYLFPEETLLIDDAFERQMKVLIHNF